MSLKSRLPGAAVLAIVAVLVWSLYLFVIKIDDPLLRQQLLGSAFAVALTSGWLTIRVRNARRTRRLMRLGRSAWL